MAHQNKLRRNSSTTALPRNLANYGANWGKVYISNRKRTPGNPEIAQRSHTQTKNHDNWDHCGGKINMKLSGHQATIGRVKRAKLTRNSIRGELFNHSKITHKTKMLLCNARIRSTLTYVTRAREISDHGQKLINSFACNGIRQIYNIYWYRNVQKPKSYLIYKTTKQPTTVSWSRTLRMKHIPLQASACWNIHPINHPYGERTNEILINEWKPHPTKTRQLLTELQQHTKEGREKHTENSFANTRMGKK